MCVRKQGVSFSVCLSVLVFDVVMTIFTALSPFHPCSPFIISSIFLVYVYILVFSSNCSFNLPPLLLLLPLLHLILSFSSLTRIARASNQGGGRKKEKMEGRRDGRRSYVGPFLFRPGKNKEEIRR